MENYFWDSCVFIAYINDEADSYDIPSIAKYIDDSKGKNPTCKIYTSGIALAEITPKRLKPSKYGKFQEFLGDFRSSVTVIDAGPNICVTAGDLNDFPYRKQDSKNRVLTTGDAIMLATALELEETYSIVIDAFHTFDNGRGKGNPEGKGIPLIDYHLWCDDFKDDPLAARVISMTRCKPTHEAPALL